MKTVSKKRNNKVINSSVDTKNNNLIKLWKNKKIICGVAL